MSLKGHLDTIVSGRHLEYEEARALMGCLMGGEADDAQIAGVLVGLRMKGATATELAGFASVMRECSLGLGVGWPDLVDTCGTGGGKSTFNMSTAAAIVAAAAGARVAKHGNRAMASSCGSADVLEHLGVRLDLDPAQLAGLLSCTGMAFLFAPAHHPAMKHVGPARKSLGVRTVFNQLGPLANPAGAKRQLIGVYDGDLLVPMAEALVMLGVEKALVVHSEDGLDEISPCAPTRYACVEASQVTTGLLLPESFGLETLEESWILAGETVGENAAILRDAVSMREPRRSSAVVPNAAAALVLFGRAEDWREGAELAVRTMASGKAEAKLEELVEASAAA